MKSVALILVCLALSCQGRVVQLPDKPIDIPVTIIEDKQPLESLSLVKEEALPIKPEILEEKAKEINEEIKPEIKEEIKPEIKEEIKPEIKEEIKPEIKPEIKEVLPAKPLELKEEIKETPQEIKETPLEIKEIPQEIKEEPKPELPEIKEQPAAEEPAQIVLKTLPAEEPTEQLAPVPNPQEQDQSEVQDSAHPQVRQATQATPTQSSTQGNFVQQLIQNSPIGQFLNQFQPQQQQQAQPTPAPAQVQADDAAQPTPAPTVPGFLNPQAAFTSAQQAVQNAAQTVVNSTTQAFQGIQQFASNLGNQFQNTLSGFANPQAAVSTTPRPPGPIQQFVNNVFGGGNATAATPAQNQQQGGNPLQGIINFLGGNRPQNAPAPTVTEAPTKKPEVDDKIDPNSQDEVAEFVPESENEIRASGETIDDSFEEAAVPSNEVIVVNDDASEGGEVADPVQPSHPATPDAVAL
ncbi:uncharacterized protein Dana_GF10264 [Drosophila ananassae]|uniref:20-hydroxyecdysone protein n=1 Tax=Drosophila ananassae TaxID=7217 RepID=B3M823_DROAN|nr:20-hydroxyecdysone protein [Drosophila ananassae]EDV39931.1 uncharacterized protein Dana_GF10264 [Drosophila ananassae]